MSRTPRSRHVADAGEPFFVWAAEYPTEEAAKDALLRQMAETYATGTASAWEWTIGQHRESHRPAVAVCRLRPRPLPLPRRRAHRYPSRSRTAVLLALASTRTPNGPPAPAPSRYAVGPSTINRRRM